MLNARAGGEEGDSSHSLLGMGHSIPVKQLDKGLAAP